MKRLFPAIFVLTLFSCNINNKETELSNKDSLLRTYLSISDSLPWTDTIDSQRKLLIAYYRNDTSYLKKSVEEIKKLLNYRYEILQDPSCPKPPGIDSNNFKEAYRFEYGAAFCDQAVNITIGQRNDSIIMFGYHYKLVYNTDSCISFAKIEKKLTVKEWNVVKQGILRADLWGLNLNNGRYGFDGSILTVTGYEMPINAFQGRYTKVSRWAAEQMALGELFKDVLEMSDIKAPCFHYY